MNTLKITITSFLLLVMASVTQWASATGVQTPGFLTALNTANDINRAGNAVYDPDCEHGESGRRGPAQARVWDAKLIDHDGDGVPDEDRVKSTNPSAGRIMRENGSLNGTSYVVGRRHLVTVSHAFAKNGVLLDGHDSMYVEVEACGNRRYEISSKSLGTMRQSTPQENALDYAVIELEEDLCPEATPLVFGSPEFEDLQGVELAAVGYYSDDSISRDATTVASSGSTFRGQTSGEDRPGLTYNQYSSYGFLESSTNIGEQRIDRYQMGQSYGGSGGPILAMLDGRQVVVGMQFLEPEGADRNFNYSLATTGPFLEFVRANVPDVSLYTPGTDI